MDFYDLGRALTKKHLLYFSRWKLYEKVPKKIDNFLDLKNKIQFEKIQFGKIQFCQLNFEVICLKKLWGAAKWFYGLLCFVFCFFFVKFARVFRVSVQIHLCSQTFVLAWRSAFYRPAASLSCCCCYFVAVHLCKILFATKSTACTANTLPEPLTIWLSTL